MSARPKISQRDAQKWRRRALELEYKFERMAATLDVMHCGTWLRTFEADPLVVETVRVARRLGRLVVVRQDGNSLVLTAVNPP